MKEWLVKRKGQIIAAAVFIALSVAVLFWWLDAPVRVARRYMNAAVKCDAMGMYDTVDEDVLAWLVEYYKANTGVDTVDVAAMAEADSAGMAEYLQSVERYGQSVSFRYTVTGTRESEADRLEELQNAYAVVPVDILKAREVDVHVTARLKGEEKTTFEQDLTLTVLQTPRGWGLATSDIFAFPNLLLALDDFAQEQFGA